MQLLFGKKSSVSKVDPCGVCSEQVGCNSSQCWKCQKWARDCCSDVPRQVRLPCIAMYLSVYVFFIIVQ